MKPSRSNLMRLQSTVFVLLLLGVMILLYVVSERYRFEVDLTWGNRNSLTETSIRLLEKLDKPLSINAFVRDDSKSVRDRISKLVGQYQRHKPDIKLVFTNPDLVPQLVRDEGISVEGEALVNYAGRQEKLKVLSEQSLTQLLVRLGSKQDGIIAFLEGHGERNPLGDSNDDWGEFGKRLQASGFQVQLLNLAKTGAIPDGIHILAIVSPQVALLDGEISLLEQYIENGGQLAWFTEPGIQDGLDRLAARLDVQRLPGVVVDATTQLFGIDDPTFAVAVDYPKHRITEQLHSQTLFPQAAGLLVAENSDWRAVPLIRTLQRSWTETNTDAAEVRYDENSGEHPGPITIGLALENTGDDKPAQRVIVFGDGDFLSNRYLGNVQNLDLGLSLFRWLGMDETFIDIGTVTAPDTRLQINEAGAIALLVVFLLIAPLALFLTGIIIWLRRRNL